MQIRKGIEGGPVLTETKRKIQEVPRRIYFLKAGDLRILAVDCTKIEQQLL